MLYLCYSATLQECCTGRSVLSVPFRTAEEFVQLPGNEHAVLIPCTALGREDHLIPLLEHLGNGRNPLSGATLIRRSGGA